MPWTLASLFAAPCLLCGLQAGDPLCAPCEADFLPQVPRCLRCALRTSGAGASGRPCGACQVRPPPTQATFTLGDYAPPLDALVLCLKQGRRPDMGRALGTLMARRYPRSTGAAEAVVVPVPMSAERWRRRGFNPAQELARGVAQALRLPLQCQMLERLREDPLQHMLGRAQRRRNLRGAFGAPRLARAFPARVLLVDDVCTTGATLEAAALALRRAGVGQVIGLVAARTP